MTLDEITPKKQEVNEAYCILLKPFVSRVFVWVGEYCALNEVVKHIGVSPGFSFVEGNANADGKFLELDPSTGLIWFPPGNMKLAVICHECFHVVCWCMRYHHIELSEQTEEVWAHSVSDLYDQVVSRVLSEVSKDEQ